MSGEAAGDYMSEKSRCPSIVIVRHAEKSNHEARVEENSVSITEKGREDSERFGRMIASSRSRLSLVKSSPITRCVSTAEAIVRGTGKSLEIIRSTALGNPGAYVVDDTVAAETYRRLSIRDIVQGQLEHKTLAGMRGIEEGTRLLLKEITKDLETLTGQGLYVTHDAILAPFTFYATRTSVVSESWFGFLEGIRLWKEEDNIFLSWQDEVFDVSDSAVGGQP